MPNRVQLLVGVLVTSLHGAFAQSHLEYYINQNSEDLTFYTTNARVNNFATTFELCFARNCISSLSATAFPGLQPANVELLQTPEHVYTGVFVSSDVNRLSLWDFETVHVCHNIVYTGDVPPHCTTGPVARGVCSGKDQVCRFRAMLDGNIVVAILKTNEIVPCDDKSLRVETNTGYYATCGRLIAPSVYEFSSNLHLDTASLATLPNSHELLLYVDTRRHDELQSGVFAVIVCLSIVVWTRTTNGGQAIGSLLSIIPSKVQRLIIFDISSSVLSTGVWIIGAHSTALIPPACFQHFGRRYTEFSLILFVLLMVCCNAVVANCVRTPLTRESVLRAIMLRHVMEIELMFSLHMFFPESFGNDLRELLGLFLGCSVLCVIGRDLVRLAHCLPPSGYFLGGTIALLGAQHACFLCLFPILYRSPGILDSASAAASVAISMCLILLGTLLAQPKQ